MHLSPVGVPSADEEVGLTYVLGNTYGFPWVQKEQLTCNRTYSAFWWLIKIQCSSWVRFWDACPSLVPTSIPMTPYISLAPYIVLGFSRSTRQFDIKVADKVEPKSAGFILKSDKDLTPPMTENLNLCIRALYRPTHLYMYLLSLSHARHWVGCYQTDKLMVILESSCNVRQPLVKSWWRH